MGPQGPIGPAGTAGASTTGGTTTAAPSGIGKSVQDFGAKGDGATDDSSAFRAALAYSAANAELIKVPAKKYLIGSTIGLNITNVIGQKWGFAGEGGKLISGIRNGSDILKITCQNTVRYLELSGLSITGTGTEGNGVSLLCFSNSWFLYDCIINNITVENCGKSGLYVEGNVFESGMCNSFFQDNHEHGAAFRNGPGLVGIVSTWVSLNCNFSQNALNGLNSKGPVGNDYAAPYDFRIYGGYMRDNGQEGLYLWNGTQPGACIDQVGFENNYKKKPIGDQDGAHVYANTRINMRNCTGHTMASGASFLLNSYMVGMAALDGCAQTDDGDAFGLTRLAKIHGDKNGLVRMTGCIGGHKTVAGTPAKWQANYCQGPLPNGAQMDVHQPYSG